MNQVAFATTSPAPGTSQMVAYSPYPRQLSFVGSTGNIVKTIQSELNKDGFNVGPVDGDFGPLTERGVKEFQKAHHLVTDGVVGPVTWAALFPSPSPILESIQGYVSTRKSDVSVAVYDNHTGKTYVYNPYQRFDTASIIKPLILATLLHQNDLHHTGITSYENQLAVPMIEQSNNNDATDLWNMVGRAPAIGTFTKLAGMTSTAPNPYGYWGLTTTTTLDQVHLMQLFAYPNRILTTSNRAYALNLMRHVVSWEGWGVSAGVKAGGSVALKNGWLPIGQSDWEINSIGYVTGDGRDYTIAILTKDNPTEAYGIATADGISEVVWNQLGSTTAR